MPMDTSNELTLTVERDSFIQLLAECRKKEEFIDVQLKIKEKLFPAHRVILSLYSPVLKTMISDQWSATKICQLSDEFVDEEIMEDLLSYLYAGSIKLTPDNAYPVCVAAHFLQIKSLLESTVEYLCKQTGVDNVLQLYMSSKCRDIELLHNYCLQFISTESEKVFQDPQILEFSFQDLKDLIIGLEKSHSDSNVRENTFHCIVRWTEKNLSERSDDLPVLLESIPLKELPFKFLTETVSTHPLVKESFPCIQAVFKALSNFQAVCPEAAQNLILVGGKNRGRIIKASMFYNSQTKTWKVLPGMKQARTHFAAVVKDQNIIVCGGYRTDDHSIDSVEMFEWSSQTWIELPSLPFRLGSNSMAIHNGELYVAGGDTDNGDSLAIVLCYSFETQKWRPVKSMNVARSDCHLIVYKNVLTDGQLVSYKPYLYAIGGGTNTVERYDPILDQWTMMAKMKNAHQWFGVTLHQNLIYACGKDGFEVYDPEKNLWTSLPAPPLPRKGTSLASMNGKLLALGGVFKQNSTDTIYEFNFVDQKWEEFGKLPSALAHHCSLPGAFF